MKNRIGLFILTAALLAPQAAIWADEATGGSPAPNATSSTPSATSKPKHHKGHRHHKKTKTPAGTPATGN